MQFEFSPSNSSIGELCLNRPMHLLLTVFFVYIQDPSILYHSLSWHNVHSLVYRPVLACPSISLVGAGWRIPLTKIMSYIEYCTLSWPVFQYVPTFQDKGPPAADAGLSSSIKFRSLSKRNCIFQLPSGSRPSGVRRRRQTNAETESLNEDGATNPQ
jgi:hypothetical protein